MESRIKDHKQVKNLYMNFENKIEILKQVDLFYFYDEITLRKLAENCREVILKKTETLFKEGSSGDSMYIILSGEIGVYKGLKQVVILGSGKYIGEMSLIESKPRSASIAAVTDALLMEISADQFKNYLVSHPQALFALMRTMSGRIRNDLDIMSRDMQKMGILVHDINNLMTPLELLMSFQETLIDLMRIPRTEQNEKKAEELIEIIFNTLEKCKKDILTLVKMSLNQIQKAKFEYIKVKSKILPLLHEIVQELQCHPHLQGKHIEIRAEGEIPDVLCNVLDIRRVLQNLLINAGYVTEQYGKIDLVVRQDKDALILSVIDKGAGISSEIIPYLLKMPISNKKDGNGFGLLSCKDIIEEGHNGKLWYESSPETGTTFFFTLPLNPSIN